MAYDLLTNEELDFLRNASEFRQLRIFISHRYDQHAELFDTLIEGLEKRFQNIDDISITQESISSSGRQRRLDEMDLRAKIAARLYTADVMIAPTNVGMGRREFTRFELELAAAAYSIPIVFVGQQRQRRKARMVGEVERLGGVCEFTSTNPAEVANAIKRLVDAETMKFDSNIPPGAHFYNRAPNARWLRTVYDEHPLKPVEDAARARMEFNTSEDEDSDRRRRRWFRRRR